MPRSEALRQLRLTPVDEQNTMWRDAGREKRCVVGKGRRLKREFALLGVVRHRCPSFNPLASQASGTETPASGCRGETKEIVLDFQELATGVPRPLEVPTLPGRATVCIGPRRGGISTSACQPRGSPGSATGALKNEERVARLVGEASCYIDFGSKVLEDVRDIGLGTP